MQSIRDQLRESAATQRRWATLAEKEGRGNLQSAHRSGQAGNIIKEIQSEKEFLLDMDFAEYRRHQARQSRDAADFMDRFL